MLLRGMLLEFILAEEVRDVRKPFGMIRTNIGRRGGMLTQIMPRLHSMTDRFRLGTLSKGISRTRKACK